MRSGLVLALPSLPCSTATVCATMRYALRVYTELQCCTRRNGRPDTSIKAGYQIRLEARYYIGLPGRFPASVPEEFLYVHLRISSRLLLNSRTSQSVSGDGRRMQVSNIRNDQRKKAANGALSLPLQAREYKKDLAELSAIAKEGKPVYGHSDLPEHIQGTAHRNSQWSQLKFAALPW